MRMLKQDHRTRKHNTERTMRYRCTTSWPQYLGYRRVSSLCFSGPKGKWSPLGRARFPIRQILADRFDKTLKINREFDIYILGFQESPEESLGSRDS